MNFLLIFGIKLKFKGNLFAGLNTGSRRALDEMFPESDYALASDIVEDLKGCYPPSNHFDQELYEQAMKEVKAGNWLRARGFIKAAALETAAPWCVSAFTKAVTYASKECPQIISGALPMNYF